MQAAHSGSAESVRILLENGADPNVKETANGQTALMFAAASDRIDVVKLLLARGADIERDVARRGFLDADDDQRRRSERRAASAGRRRRRAARTSPA